MNTQPTHEILKSREIVFANGNRAQLIAPPVGAKAADTLSALGIEQPKAIILISGGVADLDEALRRRLVQLFSRGIARAARDCDALIIDGGTQSGVIEMMGQGVADRGRRSILLGVAPAGKVIYPGGPGADGSEGRVPLDPNHSHFILVDSNEWDGMIETMIELAKNLAQGRSGVTILLNGGPKSQKEVLGSVRLGWPIIVVERTGRLADEIAALWRARPTDIEDPVMAEIIADGNLHLCPMSGSVAGFERLIVRELGGDETLKLAWDRFASLDANAIAQRRTFERLQLWILGLGVGGTLMALTQSTLETHKILTEYAWLQPTLKVMILMVPILLSILLAGTSRFKADRKWILLRASAEAIKREIFRYRTRAGGYSYRETTQTSREAKLAQNVESITRRLMRTEMNTSALWARPLSASPVTFGPNQHDDLLTSLTPDRYIAIRLTDQLEYFKGGAPKLERKLKAILWIIFILGGLGALLAALGAQLWIAMTTAVVTALTTYLGYRQFDNTLMKYNQAATDLENVRAWWLALSAEQQADQNNVDSLVQYTESVVESELEGWVQQMQDALTALREQKSDTLTVTPPVSSEERSRQARVQKGEEALTVSQHSQHQVNRGLRTDQGKREAVEQDAKPR